MDFPLHITEPLDMLIERGDAMTPVKTRVLARKRKPCDKCGGHAAFYLAFSEGGYSVHEGHEHGPQCPRIYCEHGIKRVLICHDCDREVRESEQATMYGGRSTYYGFK